MADPMTQSAHISSSQGLVDGQNSTASSKDSKFSDSFLSSSPVSLIQSPQDQRMMPSEGMASSCCFPPEATTPAGTGADRCVTVQSNKGGVCGFEPSFGGNSNLVPQDSSKGPSSNAGPHEPDSPVKTSPVSERIKALEALAAKQSDGDQWNDGGFILYKEHHREQSQTDIKAEFSTPSQKKEATPEQDSPESPFEVLGDTKLAGESEDTIDWMRAHLPPAPGFGGEAPDPEVGKEASFFPSESSRLGEAIAAAEVIEVAVPDAFMDSPTGVSKPTGPLIEPGKQSSIGEDSEFDLRFLPTAYVWEKPEKTTDDGVRKPPGHAIVQEQESPAPPAGFESPPPPSPLTSQLNAAEVKHTPVSDDFEPAEILEVDSPGESKDTVTQDTAIPVLVLSTLSTEVASTVPSILDEGKEIASLSAQQTKQTILVPIINVIETDEQVYSDEEVEAVPEDEGYQVIKDPIQETTQHANQKSEVPDLASYDQPAQDSDVPMSECPGATFDSTYQEDSPPSYMNHVVTETSPQGQSAKEDSSNGKTPSVISAEPSLEKTKQDSSVSKEPEVDALSGEPLASDKMQMQKESPVKSSLTAVETVVDNSAELSTNPIEYFEDLSNETKPSLLEVCSSDAVGKHSSPGLPSSSSDKPKNDSSKEDILQITPPQVVPRRVPDRSEANEHVPLFVEENDSDTPPAMPENKSIDEDYSFGTKTKMNSSDSDPQSHVESMFQQINVKSKEITTGDVGTIDSKEPHPKPVGGQPSPRDFNQDPFSCLWSEPQDATQKLTVQVSNMDVCAEKTSEIKLLHGESASKSVTHVTPHADPETIVRLLEAKAKENSPETSDPESIEPECSVTAATDSFVEFMRECLKSRQGEEEPEDVRHHYTEKEKSLKMAVPHSTSPPAMVFDVEEEHLNICAMKELVESREEVEQDKILPQIASKAQSPVSTTLRSPSPPCEPPCDDSASKMAEEVDIWMTEAYHLAEHVLTAVLTYLSVKDLVYWRDPKKTGVVFGTSLLLLLSLAAFSVISVVSYLLLALLCVTIAFRVYKSVVQAVQKSNDGHPFKELMDKDVRIPPETFRKHVDGGLSYVNRALKHLSRLFLVEDLVDSLKLAVLMWLMTYVGAVFNGITILILADVLLFTVPLVYEKNKKQIDHYIDVARKQINNIVSKIQEKIPGAAKRSKVE